MSRLIARADEAGDGIIALPVWNDTLIGAVPARYDLLKHKRIALEELLRYLLVLCDPQACGKGMCDRRIACCAAWTWSRWWPSGWRPAT